MSKLPMTVTINSETFECMADRIEELEEENARLRKLISEACLYYDAEIDCATKGEWAARAKAAEDKLTTCEKYRDDYEEEIVVVSLMKYHALCSKPTKIDNTMGEYVEPDEDLLWAIERVLADYMSGADFNAWMLTVKNKTSK